MPLYKSEFIANSHLLVWKITEPLQQLSDEVTLNDISKSRIDTMKSEMHQRAFLSVRKLLETAGYSDFDLIYDEFGKPHLTDGRHISISHSHEFSAIIISDKIVGIDLEWSREKIIRIAHKFAETEFPFLNSDEKTDYIDRLTVIWGVKESIFKIRNEPGISFKDHITVRPFEISDLKAIGELHFGNVNATFEIHFEIIESFVLVYAFEADGAN